MARDCLHCGAACACGRGVLSASAQSFVPGGIDAHPRGESDAHPRGGTDVHPRGGTDAQAPCRFFAQGACRFGDRCRNAHVLPAGPPCYTPARPPAARPPAPETADEAQSDELCAFATVGKCRFGAGRCKNLHGLQCPRCLLHCLHPRDVERNERHLDECLARESGPADAEAVRAIECGLCKQRVAERSDPRFGLLECTHAFCLGCIRHWRAAQGEQQARSCPLCRTVTYLIVPSSRWIADAADKAAVSAEYKRRMAAIACKHYDGGRGACPFGGSCLYAHVADAGVDGSSARAIVGGDEQLRLMREPRLSDFVESQLAAAVARASLREPPTK